MTPSHAPYLNRECAAEYLSCTTGLRFTKCGLAQRATRENGPAFRIVGNQAVYEIADLNAFARTLIEAQPKAVRHAAKPEGN